MSSSRSFSQGRVKCCGCAGQTHFSQANQTKFVTSHFYLPTKLVAFLLNCSKTKMIILLFSRGVKFTTSLCRERKKVVSNCCFGGLKVSHKQTRVRQAKLCHQQPHSVFMNLYTQTYLCRTLRTSVVGSTSVQLGFFFGFLFF